MTYVYTTDAPAVLVLGVETVEKRWSMIVLVEAEAASGIEVPFWLADAVLLEDDPTVSFVSDDEGGSEVTPAPDSVVGVIV